MASRDEFKNLVTENRLATNYANEFEKQRVRLSELEQEVFEANLRGTPWPSDLYKTLITATNDLSVALTRFDYALPSRLLAHRRLTRPAQSNV